MRTKKQLLHDFIIILMKSPSRDRTMDAELWTVMSARSFYVAALSASYLFNESTSLASRDTNIESWYHTTSRDFYRMEHTVDACWPIVGRWACLVTNDLKVRAKWTRKRIGAFITIGIAKRSLSYASTLASRIPTPDLIRFHGRNIAQHERTNIYQSLTIEYRDCSNARGVVFDCPANAMWFSCLWCLRRIPGIRYLDKIYVW